MHNKLILLLVFCSLMSTQLSATTGVNMEDEPASLETNKLCFSCHANSIYQYENEFTGKIDRKAMNPNFIYNPDDFYRGVHRHFACTDCHSPDYESFPHASELRLEEMYQCIDCHGGDPTYAQFNFEAIEEEFHKSVHSTRHDESFNCWMCHNPHSYRTMTHGDNKIAEIVEYHNQTCISCHENNSVKFQRISDTIKPALEIIHEFLPNFELHFSAVRCIECHTGTKDTMWVAHNILPKENAVKKCVECHSNSTMLISKLYKYQNIEARKNRGTFNAVLLNEAYVIGANRNIYLNIISAILFGLTLIGVAVHVFFRIKKK
ncbi:MAG: cytochrome c3 family protein [Bacteroidetes bacterium]|jgi:hypothetical protein|nr:cytochrome c3 family protein [Bacteroidota bacterium]